MQTEDRELLDHVACPVFVLSPNDRNEPVYVAFNQWAAKSLGRPFAAVRGLNAKEVFGGRLGQHCFELHCAALWEGTPRTYELLLPLKDGERLVRTTLTPRRDGDGRVTHLVGTSNDVSGEHFLREMQSEMHTISGEMENYVNLAAHDLRAPMRNLKAIAQLLRADADGLGAEKLELIAMLEDIGEKTTKLVTDVLSNANAHGGLKAEVEFDLASAIREIMVLLDPMRRVRLLHGDLRIEGDRVAFQIVLRNLIDNAIKYALPDRDRSELVMSIRIEEATEKMVEVTVADNGVGFAEPSLLFLNSGDMRAGSGYGLMGVRRVIRARGGTIMAASTMGEGARITFTLPGRITLRREGTIAA